jgi:hypothetical protein
MNDPVIALSNSLTDLAARIRSEHAAAIAATKHALERAISAGELLIEAKAQSKHGQWMPWLAEQCAIPDRTARLYMRLARHRSEIETKIGNVADFSLRRAIEAIAPIRDDDLVEEEPQRPKPGEIELPINAVKFCQDLYPRSQVIPDLVERYREFIHDLPAIEVNQRHELIDGWHRWEAHRQADRATINVRVTNVADDLEHLKLAIQGNATHGLQYPVEVLRERNHRRREQKTLNASIKRVKVTPIGSEFPDDLTYNEWLDVGRQLKELIAATKPPTDKTERETIDKAIGELSRLLRQPVMAKQKTSVHAQTRVNFHFTPNF